jgi:chorismate dehydratase
VADVPSGLNRQIPKGQLDVSPVSSILYAAQADKLQVLPHLSISAPEAVKSILLVAKRPLAELGDAAIGLTAKSQTSHGLLKIIIHYACRQTPSYHISSRTLAQGVLDTADAALFIGDDALEAYYHRDVKYFYYDLGVEWRKLTGHYMVYALWVVNRDFASRSPEGVQLVYDKVRDGFRYGLDHLEEAIKSRIGTTIITAEQLRDYIGILNYELSAEHIQSLLTYYRLAHDIGLIPAVPRISFAEVTE